MYVNGAQVLSSNIATSQTVTGYSVGFHDNYGNTGWSSTASNAYWDDVVIDDSYVGPINASAVFSDGFESNNFDAWDWTDGAVSTQSAIKHDGNYAMSYTGATNTFAAKDLGTEYNTFYVANTCMSIRFLTSGIFLVCFAVVMLRMGRVPM